MTRLFLAFAIAIGMTAVGCEDAEPVNKAAATAGDIGDVGSGDDSTTSAVGDAFENEKSMLPDEEEG